MRGRFLEEEQKTADEAVDWDTLSKWMKKMEERSAAQEKYIKRQYAMSRIRMLCSVSSFLVVLIAVIIIVPAMLKTIENVGVTMENLHDVTKSVEGVSAKFNEMDFSGLMDSMNSLLGDDKEGVSKAMEKISDLNVDDLNEAIDSLHSMVGPLGSLFGP